MDMTDRRSEYGRYRVVKRKKKKTGKAVDGLGILYAEIITMVGAVNSTAVGTYQLT